MPFIKDVTEGNETAAKEKLASVLNQKRDELLNQAKQSLQSKIFKPEGK